MYVARDKDGLLFIHIDKPYKDKVGVWLSSGATQCICSSFFPEVKWEDEEPTELILKK